MPIGRRSRYLKNAQQQTDVVGRLAKIVRRAVAPSAQTKSKRRQSYRTSGSQRHYQKRYQTVNRPPWLIKREISLGRLGVLVCLLVGLIWVGWRIVAQTAALGLITSDPGAALDWEPEEPAALTQLARQQVSNPVGNLDIARAWAERALRSDPLDSQALTVLGLIAERRGDQKNAEALIRINARRTWRDREAQAWLLNHDFRRGDFSQALLHADAIMRADYRQQTELFPVLAAFTVEPKALQALTEFLATAPPWRSWFLSQLSVRLANQLRLNQLYDTLSETQTPPTKEELHPYLDRLIRDGSFEQAYDVWWRTLPPEQRASETHPFNRDFALPIDGLPFNWNLDTGPGAEIQVVSSNDGGEKRTLLADFAGANVSFASAKQLLLLPAGDYTFTGKVKTEELITSRGLWWRIFCAKEPAETLGHSALVSGTMPWNGFTVKFHVPANCRAQWLQLELPARVESEKQIAGQVWYRDLRIVAKGAVPS